MYTIFRAKESIAHLGMEFFKAGAEGVRRWGVYSHNPLYM